MIIEQVLPSALAQPERSPFEHQLLQWYPRREGIRFNYVISDLESKDQHSDLASNDIDRQILKHIRSVSDLVVTTGATARAEKLKGSKVAPLLIVTSSNEPLGIPAVNTDSEKSVYITQKLDTDYLNPKAMAVGTLGTSITDFVVSFNKSNNFRSVVLESGLTVASEFVKANLISEICLTVTGSPDQESATSKAAAFIENLEVSPADTIQILRSGSTWFFRFRLI